MAKDQFYLVKNKAVPEVLLKVVQAKRLLETGAASSVQDAAEAVGISRSSFYKYKDDILPFHENVKGRTLTVTLFVDDRTGLLADMLACVAGYRANILTIHQSIPINGTTTITLSMEVKEESTDIGQMFDEIERIEGIHKLQVVGRE